MTNIAQPSIDENLYRKRLAALQTQQIAVAQSVSVQPAATPSPVPAQPPTEETPTRPHAEPIWLTLLKVLCIFLGTFAVVILLMQSPAYFQRARYSVSHLDTPKTQTFSSLPILTNQQVSLTDIKNNPTEYVQPNATLAGYSLTDLGDDQLLIPKIAAKAPIIWDAAPDEASMLKALQQGVAHYSFTAVPSDGRGNVFISGHSSYLLWDPGHYKTIFANLDRLETGDQIAVTYHGLVYIYQVDTKKIVEPTDTSVLEQPADPILSLMTCTPVGTNLHRLIVQARLVSARPTQPVAEPPSDLRDPASIWRFLTS